MSGVINVCVINVVQLNSVLHIPKMVLLAFFWADPVMVLAEQFRLFGSHLKPAKKFNRGIS